jgi:hypothetical protein
MLTLFATPKPMRGHNGVIQRNAIRSWTLLRPACEIILFGNDEGVAEIAAEFGLRHIPEVACNEFGTPLLSDMFMQAQRLASNDMICYINADIILLSDFLLAVQRVARMHQGRHFLMVGHRRDMDITEPLPFGPDWEQTLHAAVRQHGKLHGPHGIDFFVFPRGMISHMPAFAVGRPAWDVWLLYSTRKAKIPLIDATGAVMVVHQNHDYKHVPQSRGRAWLGPEADRNMAMAGHYRYWFSLYDATWLLTPRMLVPALMPRHIKRLPRAWWGLYPEWVFIGLQFWRAFFPGPFRFAVRQIFKF